jgi:hypothetical protein
MSDTRCKCKRVCGACGRVTQKDLERNFCPVTAWNISYNKPADRCRLFIESEDDMSGREEHIRRG